MFICGVLPLLLETGRQIGKQWKTEYALCAIYIIISQVDFRFSVNCDCDIPRTNKHRQRESAQI